MAKELEPAINVRIKGLQSPKIFTTLEQLDKWAKIEREFWNLINDTEPQPQLLKQTRNGQLGKLRTLEQHINTAKANIDNVDPFNKAINNINNTLTDYANGSILYSKSSEAKYVKKLLKEGEDVNRAYSVLRAFLNEPFNPNQQPYINEYQFLHPGHIEATAFRMGLKTDVSAEKAILDDLKSDFNELVSDVTQQQQGAYKAKQDWETKMDTLHNEQTDTFDNEVVKKANESLAKLEDIFHKKLHLEAPVQYWTQKADTHRTFATYSAIAFTATACAFIWILYKIYPSIEPILSVATKQPITAVVLIGIPAFLMIWILRFIARLLLLNVTLNTDARERAAMTKTFLALMKDEDAKMESADRILILQALFRPSPISSGDDGAPPNWFDVLVNRLDPKK